jgi:hypothetical protein
MKARLSEMRDNLDFSLNNNVKALKYLEFNKKRLILVQVISNNECYVLDEGKLSENSRNLVKSYLPSETDRSEDVVIDLEA